MQWSAEVPSKNCHIGRDGPIGQNGGIGGIDGRNGRMAHLGAYYIQKESMF